MNKYRIRQKYSYAGGKDFDVDMCFILKSSKKLKRSKIKDVRENMPKYTDKIFEFLFDEVYEGKEILARVIN